MPQRPAEGQTNPHTHTDRALHPLFYCLLLRPRDVGGFTNQQTSSGLEHQLDPFFLVYTWFSCKALYPAAKTKDFVYFVLKLFMFSIF